MFRRRSFCCLQKATLQVNKREKNGSLKEKVTFASKLPTKNKGSYPRGIHPLRAISNFGFEFW